MFARFILRMRAGTLPVLALLDAHCLHLARLVANFATTVATTTRNRGRKGGGAKVMLTCARVCLHPTPCVAQQQDVDKDQVLTAADFTNHTLFKPGAWDFLVKTFDGKSGGEHAGTCARFV